MNHVQYLRSRSPRQKFGTRLVVGVLASLWGLFSPQFGLAQGRFDDLLQRIPSSANTLMVIDVEGVHSSPLAVKEGWRSQHEANYVKSPLVLPPESDRLVLASQMNPNRGFAEVWTGAVMSVTEPVPIRSIAKAEGGYVDEIGGLPAAWTPGDVYFIAFDSKLLGVMYPAHRQAVARWTDYSQTNRTVNLSQYLKNAAEIVDGKTTQIVLAMDLKDVVQPHKLKEGLAESELTRDNAAKQEQWAKIISGIQGGTLSVRIGQSARGTLKVDFSESTAPFGRDGKTLVLDVLDKYGVHVDQMDQWKAALEGSSVVLQGELSESAMRKIFSLLELPASDLTAENGKSAASDDAAETANDTIQTSEDQTQTVIRASQAYFKSVSTLLDDLREEFRTNRDARRSLAGVFLERYARRIDRLPILNVDEELLAYGAEVAETLRSTSIASRSAGVRSGVRKSRIYGNSTYYDYDTGYYSARSTSNMRTQVQREEQAKARQTRFNDWKGIEDATAAIRAELTKKYKVSF